MILKGNFGKPSPLAMSVGCHVDMLYRDAECAFARVMMDIAGHKSVHYIVGDLLTGESVTTMGMNQREP